MDTLLVRLKPHDPRRGQVLRRFTYAGIKFQPERGWYRVERAVAEYLRAVRQQPTDQYSPLAFDVCTDTEAAAIEAQDADAAKVKRSATDELKLTPARPAGALTTEDLPRAPASPAPAPDAERDPRRGKRERE